MSGLHLTLKKIQSDRMVEVGVYQEKIEVLEREVRGMYPVDEMHELIAAHEEEIEGLKREFEGVRDELLAKIKTLEMENRNKEEEKEEKEKEGDCVEKGVANYIVIEGEDE